MIRDTMKAWSDSQSDLYSSDLEEEEDMIFGENEEDLEEMMDLSDLPTSLFACSVHEAVFEVQEQKVRSFAMQPDQNWVLVKSGWCELRKNLSLSLTQVA